MDMNDGLNKLGDRLNAISTEGNERLKSTVAQELKETRDAMQALQIAQTSNLSQTRESVLEKLHTTLAEQGKIERHSFRIRCLRQPPS